MEVAICRLVVAARHPTVIGGSMHCSSATGWLQSHIMIDCADRMVLAWRFAQRITADDLAEMLREAVFPRFVAAYAQGIEFNNDSWAGVYAASCPAVCAGRRSRSDARRLGEAQSRTVWRRHS